MSARLNLAKLNLARHVLVLCLILVLGRVPIPWAHSHEWLGPPNIGQHLRAYHRMLGSRSSTDLSQRRPEDAWHLHVYCWFVPATTGEGISPPAPPVPRDPYIEADSFLVLDKHHERPAFGEAVRVASESLCWADRIGRCAFDSLAAGGICGAIASSLRVHAVCNVYLT